MNLAPAIGLGTVIFIGSIAFRLRAIHLERASQKVIFRRDENIQLRSATWAYCVPFALFALCALFIGFGLSNEPLRVGIISFALSLAAAGGGIWFYWTLITACLLISDQEIIYTQGRTRQQVSATQIADFTIYWFSFRVVLKSGSVVVIPGTFDSSETILAFLKTSSQIV